MHNIYIHKFVIRIYVSVCAYTCKHMQACIDMSMQNFTKVDVCMRVSQINNMVIKLFKQFLYSVLRSPEKSKLYLLQTVIADLFYTIL